MSAQDEGDAAVEDLEEEVLSDVDDMGGVMTAGATRVERRAGSGDESSDVDESDDSSDDNDSDGDDEDHVGDRQQEAFHDVDDNGLDDTKHKSKISTQGEAERRRKDRREGGHARKEHRKDKKDKKGKKDKKDKKDKKHKKDKKDKSKKDGKHKHGSKKNSNKQDHEVHQQAIPREDGALLFDQVALEPSSHVVGAKPTVAIADLDAGGSGSSGQQLTRQLDMATGTGDDPEREIISVKDNPADHSPHTENEDDARREEHEDGSVEEQLKDNGNRHRHDDQHQHRHHRRHHRHHRHHHHHDQHGHDKAHKPAPIQVGDLVEARFQGGPRFFAGEVLAVHAPTSSQEEQVSPEPRFHILYDDGDEEKDVPRLRVRRIGEEQPELLQPGMRCEARPGGAKRCEWGTVVDRVGGEADEENESPEVYTVQFDSGEKEAGVKRQWIFVQCEAPKDKHKEKKEKTHKKSKDDDRRQHQAGEDSGLPLNETASAATDQGVVVSNVEDERRREDAGGNGDNNDGESTAVQGGEGEARDQHPGGESSSGSEPAEHSSSTEVNTRPASGCAPNAASGGAEAPAVKLQPPDSEANDSASPRQRFGGGIDLHEAQELHREDGCAGESRAPFVVSAEGAFEEKETVEANSNVRVDEEPENAARASEGTGYGDAEGKITAGDDDVCAEEPDGENGDMDGVPPPLATSASTFVPSSTFEYDRNSSFEVGGEELDKLTFLRRMESDTEDAAHKREVQEAGKDAEAASTQQSEAGTATVETEMPPPEERATANVQAGADGAALTWHHDDSTRARDGSSAVEGHPTLEMSAANGFSESGSEETEHEQEAAMPQERKKGEGKLGDAQEKELWRQSADTFVVQNQERTREEGNEGNESVTEMTEPRELEQDGGEEEGEGEEGRRGAGEDDAEKEEEEGEEQQEVQNASAQNFAANDGAALHRIECIRDDSKDVDSGSHEANGEAIVCEGELNPSVETKEAEAAPCDEAPSSGSEAGPVETSARPGRGRIWRARKATKKKPKQESFPVRLLRRLVPWGGSGPGALRVVPDADDSPIPKTLPTAAEDGPVSPAAASIVVGSRVEARPRGGEQFVSGVVAAVRMGNGSTSSSAQCFRIIYDGGEEEDMVPRLRVRHVGEQEPVTLTAGLRCEVKTDASWEFGRIVGVEAAEEQDGGPLDQLDVLYTVALDSGTREAHVPRHHIFVQCGTDGERNDALSDAAADFANDHEGNREQSEAMPQRSGVEAQPQEHTLAHDVQKASSPAEHPGHVHAGEDTPGVGGHGATVTGENAAVGPGRENVVEAHPDALDHGGGGGGGGGPRPDQDGVTEGPSAIGTEDPAGVLQVLPPKQASEGDPGWDPNPENGAHGDALEHWGHAVDETDDAHLHEARAPTDEEVAAGQGEERTQGRGREQHVDGHDGSEASSMDDAVREADLQEGLEGKPQRLSHCSRGSTASSSLGEAVVLPAPIDVHGKGGGGGGGGVRDGAGDPPFSSLSSSSSSSSSSLSPTLAAAAADSVRPHTSSLTPQTSQPPSPARGFPRRLDPIPQRALPQLAGALAVAAESKEGGADVVGETRSTTGIGNGATNAEPEHETGRGRVRFSLQSEAVTAASRRRQGDATAYVKTLQAHARYLGVDWGSITEPSLKQEVFFLVEQSLSAALPPGWRLVQEVEQQGEDEEAAGSGGPQAWFVNRFTGQRLSEHPLDRHFREKIRVVVARLGSPSCNSTPGAPAARGLREAKDGESRSEEHSEASSRVALPTLGRGSVRARTSAGNGPSPTFPPVHQTLSLVAMFHLAVILIVIDYWVHHVRDVEGSGGSGACNFRIGGPGHTVAISTTVYLALGTCAVIGSLATAMRPWPGLARLVMCLQVVAIAIKVAAILNTKCGGFIGFCVLLFDALVLHSIELNLLTQHANLTVCATCERWAEHCDECCVPVCQRCRCKCGVVCCATKRSRTVVPAVALMTARTEATSAALPTLRDEEEGGGS